jgi:hypothetical protein
VRSRSLSYGTAGDATDAGQRDAGIARKGGRQAEIETRQGGDVAVPNEFDEIRRRRERKERQERRNRIAIRVIKVLIVLALAAIAALFLKMILDLAPPGG